LRNFSILRATSALLPGTIPLVNRRELSDVVADCAVRSERAHALIAESVARAEAARADMEVSRAQHEKALEAATARIEAATARFEELRPKWEEERAELREWHQDSKRKTDEILAELKDGRDERRAMLEALFRVMDRLPPPPPNLRSA
jgi:chromosome segregation ATPase